MPTEPEIGEEELKRREDGRLEEMTSPDGAVLSSDAAMHVEGGMTVHEPDIAGKRHAFDLLVHRDIAICAFVLIEPGKLCRRECTKSREVRAGYLLAPYPVG